MKLIWEQPQCTRSSSTLKEPVLFFNCLKASSGPLVFAEAFSCTPHYKSNTMPFDPSPKAQGERIDHIMGLSEFLGPHQSRIAAALKKHGPFKLVNLQVLAFLLNFTSCSGQNWIHFKFLFPVRWIISPRNIHCDIDKFKILHIGQIVPLFILNKVNSSRKINLIHLFRCVCWCLCGAL